MRRQRPASMYHSVKHNSKQHCPEDLSCQPCCRCVDKLRKQNAVLKEKNQGWNREKDMYEREIMRLRKDLREWEKKKDEFQDLPQLKRRLREELKFQLDKERKVEDMILKEKVASSKEERDKLKKEREGLLEQLNRSHEENNKKQTEIKNLIEKLKDSQQQVALMKKENSKNEDELKKLKERNQTLEEAVRSKTDIITKLEGQMNVLDKNYITLKAKNSDNEFQLLKSRQEVKRAAESVHSLKKQAQQSKTSLQELSHENTKLDKLVKQLDSTIGSYSQLEGELRQRILVSQDYALQKEIEAKQLQSDFYEAIYRRSA